MPTELPIAVIGAGIIGLTSAIRLREQNFKVEIFSSTAPSRTTSAIAAAFWYPYKTALGDKTRSWCAETYNEYQRQCGAGIPGVRLLDLAELFTGDFSPPPWFDIVKDYRELGQQSLPSGFKSGYSFLTALAETGTYLPWLEKRVDELGIRMSTREIKSFDPLLQEFPLIVNCTGLGARDLVGDLSVYPIRGQLQITEPLPANQNRILVQQDLEQVTYIVPRTEDCVLGGTAEANDWNLEVSAEIASDIRARCEAILPGLRSLKTKKSLVGLRPARKEIRLELERQGPKNAVIHNYGHGGAGYTTCWGCAKEVSEIAAAFMNEAK